MAPVEVDWEVDSEEDSEEGDASLEAEGYCRKSRFERRLDEQLEAALAAGGDSDGEDGRRPGRDALGGAAVATLAGSVLAVRCRRMRCRSICRWSRRPVRECLPVNEMVLRMEHSKMNCLR